MDIPATLMHAIHIASVVFLVGGALYVTLSRAPLASGMASKIFGALALLVVSGFYQFMTRMGSGVPKGYHMWFGIKMLFALHILAVYLLIALGRGDEAKTRRWLTGISVSGLIAIVLASVLRSM